MALLNQLRENPLRRVFLWAVPPKFPPLCSGGKDDLLARHAAQVIRTPGVPRLAGVSAEGG
ncbi:hypothetical protein ACIPRS_01185 [Pseudoxanthomonas sp. LARHCG66]